MSDAEISGAGVAAPRPGVVAGLFGKLPARGDFLRLGLPRDFVQPWDDWLQRVVGGSKARLGERWLPAWMEAPIWRFALPAGMCGAAAVLGVWMPSVDRAGRHFPLTLALVLPDGFPEAPAPLQSWLARAEAAGLDALARELPPEAVTARLSPDDPMLSLGDPGAALPGLAPLAAGHALWWTEGSPFVPAGVLAFPALPEVDAFMTMLDATSATPAAPDAAGDSDATEGM